VVMNNVRKYARNSILLSQVEGISSHEDAQTLHPNEISHAIPGPVMVVPIAVPISSKLTIPTQLHSKNISKFLPLAQTKSANANAREKKRMQLSKIMKIDVEGAERVIDRLALMFQDAKMSCRKARLLKRAKHTNRNIRNELGTRGASRLESAERNSIV